MELLQLREKEIFDALSEIKDCEFVIIGGYAVNAYTLPRFSVDCDLVLKHEAGMKRIGKKLFMLGYAKADAGKEDKSCKGDFVRYEKHIQPNFKVSMDCLVKEVYDRGTGAVFSSDWVFNNSKARLLRGKTIRKALRIRVINADALFVMKMVSCRSTDIRDLFMLAGSIDDKAWIKEEVGKRCDFEERFSRLISKVSSKQFKDGLQGVFGFIDRLVFDKSKRLLLEFGK